jgi:hypothetical protein
LWLKLELNSDLKRDETTFEQMLDVLDASLETLGKKRKWLKIGQVKKGSNVAVLQNTVGMKF